MAFGLLMPRPAINGGPRWLSIMNVGIISSSKGSSIYGYRSTGAIGSLSDTTIDILGNKAITEISLTTGFSDKSYKLILGAAQANSDWETLVLGTTIFDRAAATYASGANPSWTWTRDALETPAFVSDSVLVPIGIS